MQPDRATAADDTRRRRLLLLELNEVNFELARSYVERLDLRHFRTLLNGPSTRTSSEREYEKLEPWIQWVSAHSGQTASEHGVYRLGDIVGTGVPQMFEEIEARGHTVGCVSPMNAENRLRRPAYFVPDPWTATPTDGSFWSRALGAAIAQAVNDNANGRISARSKVSLALGLLRFARPKHYALYARLAFNSRGAPWRKALFLDLFLHDFHWSLLTRSKPGFSTFFLNAGAHIQHHYLFNSKAVLGAAQRNPAWYAPADVDPFAEMLSVYDGILGDYLALSESTDLLVATGLTQEPYDKLTFYYRLTDHAAFLKRVGISFRSVLPRMTRDFLIEFDSAADTAAAAARLASFCSAGDGTPLFGDFENRGDSLFLSLLYPNEIGDEFVAEYDGGSLPMAPWVSFVAIKNGMHNGDGFAFYRGEIARYAPADGAHVRQLHDTVLRFFGAA
jgi:hypothetical protein